MHFELTSKCPLMCKQCYCNLNNGKDLDYGTALHWIHEAVNAGVKMLNLSGGETLCYPHLYDLIQNASQQGLMVNVAC